jgi:hypothetical protein
MHERKNSVSRRDLLRGAAGAVAFTFVPSHVLARAGAQSANQKLNIAAIGIGGMGAYNIDQCSSENIVALCDVHDEYAAKVFNKFPNAKKYKDFRVMLDKEDKNIDGVVIATPDHTHYVVTMARLKHGKHIYLQPLAHQSPKSVDLEAACEAKVRRRWVTRPLLRRDSFVVRMDCWMERLAWRECTRGATGRRAATRGRTFRSLARPKETPPVPATLDWDWAGPGPIGHHPIYCPMSWRGWWDFGTGALGDMGCHIIDPAFWALKLGAPTRVEATTTHYPPEVASETSPRASIVRYEFPARGDMPPVKLTWLDGRLMPPRPKDLERNRRLEGNGAIFLGDKGTIMHGSHGAGGLRIVPKKR